MHTYRPKLLQQLMGNLPVERRNPIVPYKTYIAIFVCLNTKTVHIADLKRMIGNSRPISPLSSDPSDFKALTPGHFLDRRSPP
ncbi:hypothetical protein CVS40_12810 [Lucilia cuprina]|nr:hypothetical protein CVS40_12810 [Lucilia cuprina]